MSTNLVDLKMVDEIAYITFDSDQAVNKISKIFRDQFASTVDQLIEKKTNLSGVILKSNKKDFVVGADLDEIYSLANESKDFLFKEVTQLNETLRKLETLGIPVVSLINGSALGGGYEICLATHYRVALNQPKLRIGLPEVTLGLMPGAGGTIRLPKLVGVEASFPLLMEGKQLRAEEALKQGLVDELVNEENDLDTAARKFISNNEDGTQRWDRKGYRIPGDSPRSPAFMMKLAIAPSLLKKKTKGRYPAPLYILESVAESLNLKIETAIKVESNKFCDLIQHPVAKSMISTFWTQLNEIKKGERRPNDISKTKVSKVGVIGAGMMGAGIAYVTAKSGINTVLLDTTEDKALAGKAYSEKILNKKLSRGFISEAEVTDLLSKIEATDDYSKLDGCDLIIEAVFENAKLKATINEQAFPKLLESGIYASNTSSLPITQLAKSVEKPSKFIGMHFFSPVDKMPLVELIKGEKTDDDTVAKAFDFVQQIGKTPILVNDSRGFYTSRVFATYVTEGMALLSEGVSPILIENSAKYLGMPVSPLAVSDEVSISLARHIRQEEKIAAEALGIELKVHPADSVIDAMLDKFERPGKAAGKGFYEYPQGEEKRLWEGLKFFSKDLEIDVTEIQERLLYIQSLEAVKCYEEGVLKSVGDANIGSIMGIGFAPWTGGALEYINQVGIEEFCERAQKFSVKYGDRFSPPKLLVEMAANNKTF